jgi:hypothetical protein
MQTTRAFFGECAEVSIDVQPIEDARLLAQGMNCPWSVTTGGRSEPGFMWNSEVPDSPLPKDPNAMWIFDKLSTPVVVGQKVE